MINYVSLTPELNLPRDLHLLLVDEITLKKSIPSAFYLDATKTQENDSWLFKLYQKYSFKKGNFQTYRLTEDSEDLVYRHYKQFLDYVGLPYKIRLKSMRGIRWLFPHSDFYDSYRGIDTPNGDSTSIYIGIITNSEITNWYSFNGQFKMNNIFHLLQLKKEKSICLKDRESCLFDNSSIHSVTNCNPKKERWGLAISWQGASFETIKQKYLEYIK